MGLQAGPPLLASPLHNPGNPRARDSPGTGRGFQAPRPPLSPRKPGRLARWKSRARPETRRGCREIWRKTSAFFSLPFLALTLPRRPPPGAHVGQPPHAAPRPSPSASQSPLRASRWAERTVAEATPRLRESLKGGAGRGGTRSLTRRSRAVTSLSKPWITPAEDLAASPGLPAAGRASLSPELSLGKCLGLPGPGVCALPPGTAAGRAPLWIITAT